jgi:UDP-glucose 4-epimerase
LKFSNSAGHISAVAERAAFTGRVVVFGGSGVIGRALLPQLAALGVETLSPGSRKLDLISSAAEGDLAATLRANDTIIMLAGLTPDRGRDYSTLLRNVDMAINIVAAISKSPVAKLVYISSDAVYAPNAAAIAEDSLTMPNDTYSAAHLLREHIFERALGEQLLVLRLTQVTAWPDPHLAYGPARFRHSAETADRITLYGRGEELRDHISVDDAAAAILRLAALPISGVVNVASGRSVDFHTIAKQVASRFSPSIPIEFEPRRVPIWHRRFDTRRLRALLPDFYWTPIEDAVARLYATEKSR